jgi:hypothetical protein
VTDRVHTGERQLFANLEQLFAFVEERCESQAPVNLEAERRDMEEDKNGDRERRDRLNGKW